jgi:DNA-binding FrmR family transcriptional regulator
MITQEGCTDSSHPSYEKHLARLSRLAGQLKGVEKMINEKRYCPDILTQLRAIRSAVRSLELQMLDSHLSHCVVQAFEGADQNAKTQKIAEIRELIKTFD